MTGGGRKKDKKERRVASYVVFVLLLVAAIFLPGKWPFVALVGFIAVHMIAGFVHPPAFDTISRIMGVYLMLIVLIETAHAGAAYRYGIPVKGVSVSLIGFDEGGGAGPSGWVELDIDEEIVDASPKLQSQMSWVAAMGSIILVVFGFFYFILKSAGNFPAVVASILFVFHQIPILQNDQSYMISQGWMSPAFAWAIFIGGIIVLLIAAAKAPRGEKMIEGRHE